MSQLVFIHGPGAGGCAEGYYYQLKHFPGSLAPDLPGHPEGESLSSVADYTEWLRDWLHKGGHNNGLVLAGFTLGACVALQYALDYPDEVAGLFLMTIAMRPKERAIGALEFRLNAAKDAKVHQEWLDALDVALADAPGLLLAGASYRGVGIPDCIHQGMEAAQAIRTLASQHISEAGKVSHAG